jgi:hypothetical protein
MILHIYKEVIRSTRNSNRAIQTIKTELSIPKMSACPSLKRHDDIRFQLFGNATTITETQVVPTITIDDVSCDEDSKRSEPMISPTKSDHTFLKITGKCKNERQTKIRRCILPNVWEFFEQDTVFKLTKNYFRACDQ